MKSWIVLSVFLAGISCYPSREYFGSKCKNSGTNGICTLVPDCPEAVESLDKYRSHNFKRCGFDGDIEIVCCPTDKKPKPDPGTAKPEVRAPDLDRSCALACKRYIELSTVPLSYHIINGKEAEAGEYPHMAALGYYHPEDKAILFDCGGTLISDQYILTAAHCFRTNNSLEIARLGTLNAPLRMEAVDPVFDFNVSSHVAHPEYNWKTKINDIALVKLKTKVRLNGSFLLPACLYDKGDDPAEMWVTGWGATDLVGERSEKLLKAKLRSFPLQECNTTYQIRTNKNILDTQLCAIDDKSDACQGDSGGPLQIPTKNGSNIYSIVGVTSYGIGCGSRYSAIYTRVYSYLSWIEPIVWPTQKKSSRTSANNRLIF